MPTKYLVLIVGGNERDNILVRVLNSMIIELEKLKEDKKQAEKTTCIQQWNRAL